ncbi:lipocalin 2, isoform CRA_b [Rattus norvegicus]|uniref:Lipocalin 2, isoform CRA_b n=1 Tax=Rattus norvegicus TaxID=10116 RepID=A6JU60_RAT|nr:lipocalin 2, isoform CRA_b [Rattus norvegicus]
MAQSTERVSRARAVATGSEHSFQAPGLASSPWGIFTATLRYRATMCKWPTLTTTSLPWYFSRRPLKTNSTSKSPCTEEPRGCPMN